MAAREQADAINGTLYPSAATPPDRNCACGRNTFSPRRRCRTSYGGTSCNTTPWLRCPTRRQYKLNDTHPAIAVAELMRILVDEHDFPWREAWSITRRTLSYTNHTLLPEALESWPTSLMNRLLPRHLQIIYLINWFHLRELSERGIADRALIASVSLIEEAEDKRVRMGHLAFVGSHKVNGVSALHTELMRRTVFHGSKRPCPARSSTRPTASASAAGCISQSGPHIAADRSPWRAGMPRTPRRCGGSSAMPATRALSAALPRCGCATRSRSPSACGR